MRRDFRLPEQDEQFLEGLGLGWETISEPSNRWLLLRAYPIPGGYNHVQADVAVNVSPGYPDAQLDMVYFHPHLARLDGKALIQVGGGYSISGRDWQRWSRHRTPVNPWRPGVDDVATHLGLMDEWLVRGLK